MLNNNGYKPKLCSVFLLGFSSGLPFLLILSTLSIWLTEAGISKTVIGLFAWASVPYTLKVLWVPIVAHFKAPIFGRWLGLRRGWIALSQTMLFFAVIALGHTSPETNLTYTAIFALMVGLFSAIQDIVVETYRLEILPQEKMGPAASASALGYKLGMLCSGAGTLFLAEYYDSWATAYTMVATLFLVGVAATILSHEPILTRTQYKLALSKASLHALVVKPINSFMQQQSWHIVIFFILSYKVADTVLNMMTAPFLVDIGFNKMEIASVAKTFGITAMIVGGFAGGIILSRLSLRQTLFITVILQLLASALFIVQAQMGNNIQVLFITMGVENFTCGMSQVALIAYLSQLCSQPHTAMHYAILSSFASFVRVYFSALTGWLADQFAWPEFYSIVCISCLPSLLLLFLCTRHFAIQTDPQVLAGKPSLAGSRF